MNAAETGEGAARTTTHRILRADARLMPEVDRQSVDLVVTSPPYPMIAMWDAVFAALNPESLKTLRGADGPRTFELMHRELDKVWKQCHRVLKPGGFACINIGDATRTVRGDFRLYTNHSRILEAAVKIGFTPLPDILWRKPNNSPTKFLGSGMLPAGAYVTYEHEYILILRKGFKREFLTGPSRRRRSRSAFFWEERNAWFSDVWMELRGARQGLLDAKTRKRSGAFPFELAYRLIHMYSLEGDTVLDPFLGTGTTTLAAAAGARHSIGLEIDPALRKTAEAAVESAPRLGRKRVQERLQAHLDFIEARIAAGKEVKHVNAAYGFPVVTRQETGIELRVPATVRKTSQGCFEVRHKAARRIGPPARQKEMPFPARGKEAGHSLSREK